MMKTTARFRKYIATTNRKQQADLKAQRLPKARDGDLGAFQDVIRVASAALLLDLPIDQEIRLFVADVLFRVSEKSFSHRKLGLRPRRGRPPDPNVDWRRRARAYEVAARMAEGARLGNAIAETAKSHGEKEETVRSDWARHRKWAKACLETFSADGYDVTLG